jgi:hypothetical protein
VWSGEVGGCGVGGGGGGVCGMFPEMEVTEIILAKIYRFCQLSSHGRGFLARV